VVCWDGDRVGERRMRQARAKKRMGEGGFMVAATIQVGCERDG